MFYWQTIGGVSWHPELVAPNGTVFSPPSVKQVGNSSVIAVEGPVNSLRFYWQTIGGVPWHPELVAGLGTTFA
jgi:gamma-glutamyl-gamma-aminobutyrate hydrolase PuuD